MKILELANALKAIYDKHGDVEVMFADPNSDSVYAVEGGAIRIAEDGDFPDDWNMPAGFKFAELRN